MQFRCSTAYQFNLLDLRKLAYSKTALIVWFGRSLKQSR